MTPALCAGGISPPTITSTSGDVDIVTDDAGDVLAGGSFSNRWGIDYYGDKYILKSANSNSNALRCTATYPGADIITATFSSSISNFKWTFEHIPVYPHGLLLYNIKTQSVVTDPTKSIRPGVTSTLSALDLTVAVYSGYVINQDVTWTSSNASVATLNSTTGTVTGVTYGSTRIAYAVEKVHADRRALCMRSG